MTERPEDFYSKGAEKFAQDYSIENMPEAYKDLLDAFVQKVGEGKVLDAGCGHGRDVEYFTEKGLDATGVDLADGMIDYARENMEGTFHKMDVKNLDFKENGFSGVWCNTVIQFFPPEEMPEVLDELKRVLTPEGVLYISFKIGNSSIKREGYGSEVKQYLISEKRVRELLRDKGLEIKEVERAEVNGTEIMNIITEMEK